MKFRLTALLLAIAILCSASIVGALAEEKRTNPYLRNAL